MKLYNEWLDDKLADPEIEKEYLKAAAQDSEESLRKATLRTTQANKRREQERLLMESVVRTVSTN